MPSGRTCVPPRRPADERGRPAVGLVGAAEHLDGVDALVGEPVGLDRRRRAALRALPRPDGRRPPGPGRGHRGR